MKEIYRNGTKLSIDTISYDLNPAFLYGESVFTSSHITHGNVPFWSDHQKRILDGVNSYFFLDKLEDSQKAQMEQRLHGIPALCKNFNHGYVRVVVVAEQRDGLVSQLENINQLNIICILSDQLSTSSELKVETLDLGNQPFPSHIKIGSYGRELYWLRQLRSKGLDDYIRTNGEQVLEASTSNIFIYQGDNHFVTPRIIPGMLDGIAHNHVVRMLREQGYECLQRPVTIEELLTAEEIFLTNAVKGICPVVELNKKIYNNNITQKVSSLWKQYCQ
jgi:branched-chain amino acid aminotransferase